MHKTLNKHYMHVHHLRKPHDYVTLQLQFLLGCTGLLLFVHIRHPGPDGHRHRPLGPIVSEFKDAVLRAGKRLGILAAWDGEGQQDCHADGNGGDEDQAGACHPCMEQELSYIEFWGNKV